MPLFLLIRHGENNYVKEGRLAGRTPGVNLNERGRKQAEELADALADFPISAIYSSPMERAQQTAEPLARQKDIQVQIRDGLLETDIGDWTGLELKKLSKLREWKTVQRTPSRFRFPGGESFQEEQTRLVSAIESLASQHKPEDVIALVFHADPIKLVLAYYLGMPLDNFQRLGCDTASVSVMHLSEKGVMVLKQNLRPPFKLSTPGKK